MAGCCSLRKMHSATRKYPGRKPRRYASSTAASMLSKKSAPDRSCSIGLVSGAVASRKISTYWLCRRSANSNRRCVSKRSCSSRTGIGWVAAMGVPPDARCICTRAPSPLQAEPREGRAPKSNLNDGAVYRARAAVCASSDSRWWNPRERRERPVLAVGGRILFLTGVGASRCTAERPLCLCVRSRMGRSVYPPRPTPFCRCFSSALGPAPPRPCGPLCRPPPGELAGVGVPVPARHPLCRDSGGAAGRRFRTRVP